MIRSTKNNAEEVLTVVTEGMTDLGEEMTDWTVRMSDRLTGMMTSGEDMSD